uniref:Uncharacterized protein n=1 Tax=Heliothis virescens TaxID=7102 RepID=A0A2A4K4J3_HELVI
MVDIPKNSPGVVPRGVALLEAVSLYIYNSRVRSGLASCRVVSRCWRRYRYISTTHASGQAWRRAAWCRAAGGGIAIYLQLTRPVRPGVVPRGVALLEAVSLYIYNSRVRSGLASCRVVSRCWRRYRYISTTHASGQAWRRAAWCRAAGGGIAIYLQLTRPVRPGVVPRGVALLEAVSLYIYNSRVRSGLASCRVVSRCWRRYRYISTTHASGQAWRRAAWCRAAGGGIAIYLQLTRPVRPGVVPRGVALLEAVSLYIYNSRVRSGLASCRVVSRCWRRYRYISTTHASGQAWRRAAWCRAAGGGIAIYLQLTRPVRPGVVPRGVALLEAVSLYIYNSRVRSGLASCRVVSRCWRRYRYISTTHASGQAWRRAAWCRAAGGGIAIYLQLTRPVRPGVVPRGVALLEAVSLYIYNSRVRSGLASCRVVSRCWRRYRYISTTHASGQAWRRAAWCRAAGGGIAIYLQLTRPVRPGVVPRGVALLEAVSLYIYNSRVRSGLASCRVVSRCWRRYRYISTTHASGQAWRRAAWCRAAGGGIAIYLQLTRPVRPGVVPRGVALLEAVSLYIYNSRVRSGLASCRVVSRCWRRYRYISTTHASGQAWRRAAWCRAAGGGIAIYLQLTRPVRPGVVPRGVALLEAVSLYIYNSRVRSGLASCRVVSRCWRRYRYISTTHASGQAWRRAAWCRAAGGGIAIYLQLTRPVRPGVVPRGVALLEAVSLYIYNSRVRSGLASCRVVSRCWRRYRYISTTHASGQAWRRAAWCRAAGGGIAIYLQLTRPVRPGVVPRGVALLEAVSLYIYNSRVRSGLASCRVVSRCWRRYRYISTTHASGQAWRRAAWCRAAGGGIAIYLQLTRPVRPGVVPRGVALLEAVSLYIYNSRVRSGLASCRVVSRCWRRYRYISTTHASGQAWRRAAWCRAAGGGIAIYLQLTRPVRPGVVPRGVALLEAVSLYIYNSRVRSGLASCRVVSRCWRRYRYISTTHASGQAWRRAAWCRAAGGGIAIYLQLTRPVRPGVVPRGVALLEAVSLYIYNSRVRSGLASCRVVSRCWRRYRYISTTHASGQAWRRAAWCRAAGGGIAIYLQLTRPVRPGVVPRGVALLEAVSLYIYNSRVRSGLASCRVVSRCWRRYRYISTTHASGQAWRRAAWCRAAGGGIAIYLQLTRPVRPGVVPRGVALLEAVSLYIYNSRVRSGLASCRVVSRCWRRYRYISTTHASGQAWRRAAWCRAAGGGIAIYLQLTRPVRPGVVPRGVALLEAVSLYIYNSRVRSGLASCRVVSRCWRRYRYISTTHASGQAWRRAAWCRAAGGGIAIYLQLTRPVRPGVVPRGVALLEAVSLYIYNSRVRSGLASCRVVSRCWRRYRYISTTHASGQAWRRAAWCRAAGGGIAIYLQLTRPVRPGVVPRGVALLEAVSLYIYNSRVRSGLASCRVVSRCWRRYRYISTTHASGQAWRRAAWCRAAGGGIAIYLQLTRPVRPGVVPRGVALLEAVSLYIYNSRVRSGLASCRVVSRCWRRYRYISTTHASGQAWRRAAWCRAAGGGIAIYLQLTRPVRPGVVPRGVALLEAVSLYIYNSRVRSGLASCRVVSRCWRRLLGSHPLTVRALSTSTSTRLPSIFLPSACLYAAAISRTAVATDNRTEPRGWTSHDTLLRV